MPQYYSFKTEVSDGEECFFSDDEGITWDAGKCKSVLALIEGEKVSVEYSVADDGLILSGYNSDEIASKTAFLEWQSRLIDCAKDQFKFKGNVEKMFGPESYSNWIPFYKDDISPSNAYMQGMGLVDLTKEDDED